MLRHQPPWTFCIRSSFPVAKFAILGEPLTVLTKPHIGSLRRRTVTSESTGLGSGLKLNIPSQDADGAKKKYH